MHLFTNSASPNGQRVTIAMKEKGIDIPTTEIDLRAAENLSDEFRRRNPIGRVPVLETDSGVYIAESVAITRYLESLAPEPNLFGVTGEEQALIEMWNRRVELNLLQPVAQAFRNLTGFFKDREKISKEWGEISAETARSAVPVFEAQLANNKYIAGDSFSVADISLAVTLTFAKNTRQDFLDSPVIHEYHTRITSRSSFQ